MGIGNHEQIGQPSSNRVGEIAVRNLTDAVIADCLSLRLEDCPYWTMTSSPIHSRYNLTASNRSNLTSGSLPLIFALP